MRTNSFVLHGNQSQWHQYYSPAPLGFCHIKLKQSAAAASKLDSFWLTVLVSPSRCCSTGFSIFDLDYSLNSFCILILDSDMWLSIKIVFLDSHFPAEYIEMEPRIGRSVGTGLGSDISAGVLGARCQNMQPRTCPRVHLSLRSFKGVRRTCVFKCPHVV